MVLGFLEAVWRKSPVPFSIYSRCHSELASDLEVHGSKEWYVMCWVWRKRILYVWGKWDTWLTTRTNETMFTHPKLPFVCNQMVFPQSRSMNWSVIMVVRSPCWKVFVILLIVNSNKIETNKNGFWFLWPSTLTQKWLTCLVVNQVNGWHCHI